MMVAELFFFQFSHSFCIQYLVYCCKEELFLFLYVGMYYQSHGLLCRYVLLSHGFFFYSCVVIQYFGAQVILGLASLSSLLHPFDKSPSYFFSQTSSNIHRIYCVIKVAFKISKGLPWQSSGQRLHASTAGSASSIPGGETYDPTCHVTHSQK